MSYNSRYVVSLSSYHYREEIRNLLRQRFGLDKSLASDYDIVGDLKWYEWEEDLLNFSKEISSEVLITCDRYGENWGDIERGYFKNGKKQVVKGIITFEECKI